MSAVLGWLADHSQPVARALARRFLVGDDEALSAVDRAAQVGARTQVRLPRLAGGPLWADLTVDGAGREFQLIVEVKLGSDFHIYSGDGIDGSLSQPDAYLAAWRRCEPTAEARVRRLGTLTLSGQAPASSDPWRAGDLTWKQIHALLAELCDGDALAADVQTIAAELRDHLAQRVLPPELEPGFLDWGAKLTRAVCERLAGHVPEPTLHGQFTPRPASHYVGGYLGLAAPSGSRERLWLVVGPAGGDWNVPGWPATLQMTSVLEYPPGPDTRARLLGAGFEESKDKMGIALLRAMLPVADIRADPDFKGQVGVAADWAAGLLRAAGLAASR